MAKCGNCKQDGKDVAHIKACYAALSGQAKPAAPAPVAQVVKIKAPAVPQSKYALYNASGTLVFVEVRNGKKGSKWEGFQFVDRLIGHPGDWQRAPIKGSGRAQVLEQIAYDPKGAAVEFSKRFTVCACCGSPLSDEFSIANGLGPVCIQRFSGAA